MPRLSAAASVSARARVGSRRLPREPHNRERRPQGTASGAGAALPVSPTHQHTRPATSTVTGQPSVSTIQIGDGPRAHHLELAQFGRLPSVVAQLAPRGAFGRWGRVRRRRHCGGPGDGPSRVDPTSRASVRTPPSLTIAWNQSDRHANDRNCPDSCRHRPGPIETQSSRGDAVRGPPRIGSVIRYLLPLTATRAWCTRAVTVARRCAPSRGGGAAGVAAPTPKPGRLHSRVSVRSQRSFGPTERDCRARPAAGGGSSGAPGATAARVSAASHGRPWRSRRWRVGFAVAILPRPRSAVPGPQQIGGQRPPRPVGAYPRWALHRSRSNAQPDCGHDEDRSTGHGVRPDSKFATVTLLLLRAFRPRPVRTPHPGRPR